MGQVTVVISRLAAAEDGAPEFADLSNPFDLDPEKCRAIEDAVAAGLREAGRPVTIIPHLYYLTGSHPVVRELAELPGELVVGSWLYPRAAQWTLRALGVDAGWCVFLADASSAAECVERLLEAAGARDGGVGAAEFRQLGGPVKARWYPVLDYERCKGCGQCYEFCLFGVYSMRDDRVVVSEPDRCKPGCPACARLCPAGAIIFPHCAADHTIAGRPVAGGPPADGAEGAEEEPDDLDDLIDALERLD